MSFLVDTNILLRSAQPTHSLCFQATRAVSRLMREGETLFFCSQNIAEFWNVATRPADRNGLGFSSEEAWQEVSSIEGLLTLLPDSPGIYTEWKRLVKEYKVQGVSVYDARLIAVMRLYVVEQILTFNVDDFRRYGNVRAVHPSSLQG
jgi:predicted nucleic acid-binding protein